MDGDRTGEEFVKLEVDGDDGADVDSSEDDDKAEMREGAEEDGILGVAEFSRFFILGSRRLVAAFLPAIWYSTQRL